MSRKPPKRTQERAPRGSVGETLLLRLGTELAEAARESAEAEGITVAEWWRRAGRDRVLRQAGRSMGLL